MMDYSPVSTPPVGRSRTARRAVVLGLMTVTGLLVVVGLISIPSGAAAAETPIGPGTAATNSALAGQAVNPRVLADNVGVSPGDALTDDTDTPTTDDTTIKTKRPCGGCHPTSTTTKTKHPCGGCHPTTTTTTKHPCGVCHPTSTTTTTTTDDTDTTTSTTPTTTDSTAPGTGTSDNSGGTPGGQGNDYPSGPDQLAHTGSNPTLVPLVVIGSLLLILGGLLILVVRTRTHRSEQPPTT